MTTKTPEECLIEWEKASVSLARFAKPIGSTIAGAGKWMASKFKAPTAKAWTPPSYSASGAVAAAAPKTPFMQRAFTPAMVAGMTIPTLSSAYQGGLAMKGQLDHNTGRLEGGSEALAQMMNQFGNMGMMDRAKMLFAGKDAFTSDAGRQSIQEFLNRNKDPELQKYGPVMFSKALDRLKQMQEGATDKLAPITGYMAGQQEQMDRTTQGLKALLQANANNPALQGVNASVVP